MMRTYNNIKILAVMLFLFTPFYSKAEVVITEIMFDPAGADAGREWLEIRNIGLEAIDVTTLKLFENNVNHSIKLHRGNQYLEVGEYAVVADKAESIVLEYADKQFSLFDSAFSLSNEGEEVAIKTNEGITYHSVLYDPEIGSKGNTHALQWNGTIWISGAPTPGSENATEHNDGSDGEGEESSGAEAAPTSETSSHASPVALTSYARKIKAQLGVGRIRLGSINAPLTFVADVPEGIRGAKIEWSFGDGSSGTGKKIDHAYEYPGTYVVVGNLKSRDGQAVSRTTVVVDEPQLLLELATGSVSIVNSGNNEINLGKWILVSEHDSWVFPKDTLLLPGTMIRYPIEPTGFAELLFPTRDLAFRRETELYALQKEYRRLRKILDQQKEKVVATD